MSVSPRRAVLLLLLLTPICTLAQESIPVTIGGGAVLVPVKISDRIFNFLLDTGSSRSVIDPVTAANLGWVSEETQRIQKNFRDLVVDHHGGKYTYDREASVQSCATGRTDSCPCF
jgi:hypothetical protein